MSSVRRALWVIALALVAATLIGNAVMSYRNTVTLAAGDAESVRSRDVAYAIDDLLSTVTDAETGQRGYLLAQEPAYLAPYQVASHSIAGKLVHLKELLADNPEQLQRLAQVEQLIARKLEELHNTIELVQAGNREAALTIVATNTGKQLMDEIRQRVDAMYAVEKALQNTRDARAQALYAQSQYTRILGMVVGLGLVGLAALLLRRDLQARARAAREIFREREWFSTTLRSIGDAVIVTDPQGRIVLINSIAEKLTGWGADEAADKPLLEVFDIINETTRERATDPVACALAERRIVGLANHTVLRSRAGREYVIEDSAAPIYDVEGAVQGAVMVFHDSTQRRESEIVLSKAMAETAHRSSTAMAAERTLNTILDNAPIGILMTGPDPDFAIVALSQKMREWLDTTEGTPAYSAYRKIMPDGSVPAPHLLPLNRAMHKGATIRDEQWIVERPGQQPLTVVVNVAPVRDGDGTIIGAVHSWVDLSERQQLDRALRVIESRLRVLVDANVIGLILSFDRNGNVAQANNAFLDMLGFDAAELADGSINLRTQTPEEYRAADDRAMSELAERGYCAPYEKELMHKTGARRVSVVVGYAKVAEADNEYVGFVLDVSARKQLERQLHEQTEQLLVANRRKDEFLAMLAHELRNPLAPLRNAVYLLDTPDTADPAQLAGLLPTMRRQIEYLVRLVDDLLDAARISEGKITIERGVVELQSVLYAAVEIVKPLIASRSHQLELELPPQALHVDGDSTRLIQMFSNVVHNAAKYTHPNGRIRVVLERDGNEAVVRVRDNGQGIRPDLLPRVFETFVQDDQSLARSAGGLGIGLALVRRLIELHGGSVSAHSEGADRGSEFELRLPVVDTRALAPAPQGRAYEPARTVTKQRVLVVDDNIDLAASTSALLEMWGHESKEVHNGKDVLQLAEAFQPTVILLDIGLPGMDGFEVARSIRARADFANMYLVAMTGYGQDRDRQNAHEAGFNAHLVKPVQPSALELLLNRLPV